MATVSTYLNFKNNTEEVFGFYKTVFGTDYQGNGIMRFGDVPPSDDMSPMPEHIKNLVMHVSLPILGGHVLMGSDAPEEMGLSLQQGNNVYIMLRPDTREETRRLYAALSAGGVVEQELQDMFWGDYYGSCRDKYGICWMFNCETKA